MVCTYYAKQSEHVSNTRTSHPFDNGDPVRTWEGMAAASCRSICYWHWRSRRHCTFEFMVSMVTGICLYYCRHSSIYPLLAIIAMGLAITNNVIKVRWCCLNTYSQCILAVSCYFQHHTIPIFYLDEHSKTGLMVSVFMPASFCWIS